MSKRPLDAHDDRPHEHGGEAGWREQLVFTFADPAICGVVRATWDPLERVAFADLAIRLEDGVVARATAREDGGRGREDAIGGFAFVCDEKMRAWRLGFKLSGLLLAPLVAGTNVGRSAPVEGSLEVTGLGPADGYASRRRVVTEQRFASIISSGAFAQPLAAKGELRIGPRRLKIDALGVRTRSWGVREADPGDARLLVAFDAAHAAWFDRQVLGDDAITLAGALGAIKVPNRLDVARGEQGAPSRLVLGGLSAEVLGEVPNDPTGGLFVRCRSGDRDALGFAELARTDAAAANVGVSAQPQGDDHAVADGQDA